MKIFRFLLIFCICSPSVSLFSVSKVISLTTPSNSTSVTYSDEVNLDANQSASIFRVNWNDLGGSSWSQSYIKLQISINDTWYDFLQQENLTADQKFILKGPCKFRIAGKSHYVNSSYKRHGLTVFYNEEIIDLSTGTVAKFATVIPENLENNVTITLQQSTDLVNWSSASPGVFSPSTTKRFFRVVSQQQ